MARHSRHHEELTDGVGRCGVPSWAGGSPAGFCDEPAYGDQEPGQRRYGEWLGGLWSHGYSSALACPAHGGPRELAL
jgi:hypothetical protein